MIKTRPRLLRGSLKILLSGCLPAFIAAGCLLGSCSDEGPEKNVPSPPDLKIAVDGTVRNTSGDPDNAFAEGDAIGLTVVKWRNGERQPLDAARQEDNVRYTCLGGKFIPSFDAYFPDKTTPCTFYAYYPYSGKGIELGGSEVDVAVLADQSGDGYHASDFMAAVAERVVPDGKPVRLGFGHALSKVTVHLRQGEGCTHEQIASAPLRLVSLLTGGRYDMETGGIRTVPGRGDIIPKSTEAAAGNGIVRSMKAIVVPQSKRAGESVFYLSIDGRTVAYKPATEFVFASGKEHELTVTVSIVGDAPMIEVSSQIRDWTDTEPVTGGADERSPYIGKVADIEGNEYPYVELEGLWWMAADLRTAKLNDGTPVEMREGGTRAWTELVAPAFCALNNDASNLVRYGALYNYYTVRTGKLCPAGWRLPTADEFSALSHNGDETYCRSLMKRGAWAAGYGATGETGFAAVPGGISTDSFTEGDAYYWTSTFDATAQLPAYYFYLSQYSYVSDHFQYAGMSVRCVREPGEDPDPDKVADREGNVYGTVEINGLRWMSENLRSTVLTDGTPITKMSGVADQWKAAAGPAYCALDDEDANLALYGPLYNYKTVESGKICPEGWRLPTQNEFDGLTDNYSSRGPNIMATEGWRQNGNNSTGFSALPGGTFMARFTSQDAGFWSSEADGTWILYLYVSYISTQTEWKNNDGSYGMSIRCVRETVIK